MGMLQEEGPLIMSNDGMLVDNPYAWTKLGHLLVLESPAGVGYSYCAAMTHGGDCNNTDITTAKAAHAALVDLFTTKFPEWAANPFFITGESYAGVYAPTLAAEIVAHNRRLPASSSPRINLVGMAVGDPCTDTELQRQSMDMLWYAHKYGLLPTPEYTFLTEQCGASHPSARMAGAWSVDRKSGRVVPAQSGRDRFKLASRTPNCTLAMRKYLLSTSKGISQNWEHAYINELAFYDPAEEFRFDLPGTLNYNTAAWMMRDDVKKALHVDTAPVKAWPGPTPGWQYTSVYNACNEQPTDKRSMVDFYRELAPALPGKIVVYNGDTDPCVSYEGTRVAIRAVGFAEVQPYRPWFFNFSAASLPFLEKKDLLFGPKLSLQQGGAQYGGSIVDYEHGLSFATVHGSGHMVPTFRPRAALQLLAHVVGNTSFTPPTISDAALLALDDNAFDSYVDQWTLTAEGAPFVRA